VTRILVSPGSPADTGGAAPGKDYLGPGDIATLLGVSLHTVRAWRKHGRLPAAYKVGKILRWERVDIENWVKGHREKARSSVRPLASNRVGGRA
jgi:excisionase family DNA binding protein